MRNWLPSIWLRKKDGKTAPDTDKAYAHIKAAAGIKGYDMYRTVQLKLHALRNLAASHGKSSGDESKADDVDDAREKLIEAHLNDDNEPEETEDEHL